MKKTVVYILNGLTTFPGVYDRRTGDIMKTAAIIPAAGSGKRMGGVQKQFLEIGGIPVIVHTLRKLQRCSSIDTILLVVPREKIEYCWKNIVKPFGLIRIKEIVEGGRERQESVANGLIKAKEFDIILIHDGVRPFLDNKMIEGTIDAAVEFGAAVTAIPVKDTIKEVNDRGIVMTTMARDKLRLIQTPQAFRRGILEQALKNAGEQGLSGTDESSLVERAGFEVRTVPGSERNIKITTEEDMALAEQFYQREQDHS